MLELGDAMALALAKLGITEDRVEKWLNAPCRCKDRQEKLNQLSRMLKRMFGIDEKTGNFTDGGSGAGGKHGLDA